MSGICFIVTDLYNKILSSHGRRLYNRVHFYLLNNWLKNLLVVIYLNRFVLYFRDKVFEVEMWDETGSRRTNNKESFLLAL